MDLKEGFAQNGAVKIHYLHLNADADGTPLVMVPGMVNSAGEVNEELGFGFGCPVVHLSLRGRGKSDSPDGGYTFGEQVGDIKAVTDHLQLEEYFLYGHSVGSSFAIGHAAQAPQNAVKGLIMGDFAPFYPPFDEKWVMKVLEHPDLDISEKAVRAIADDAEYVELAQTLAGFKFPVLVLRGALEGSALPAPAVEMIRKIVPHCQTAVLEESAHELLLPTPNAFVELLNGFMASA